MGISFQLYNLFRTAYGPLTPLTREEKESFLNDVREKVAFYKPRIEDKTGVDLGVVKIRDRKLSYSDRLWNLALEASHTQAWINGKLPTTKSIQIRNLLIGFFGGILGLIPQKLDSFLAAGFGYENGTIYAPFNLCSRMCDPDLSYRRSNLDCSVTHELSHHLWRRIKNPPVFEYMESDSNTDFYEGFATYCSEEYFREFYPKNPPNPPNPPIKGKYLTGKRKIEKLVKKHGEKIILDIPKRWKEFDKELKN